MRKWIGYFVLTVKVTGTHFSHKNEVSSTNSFHNKLHPYSSPIWTPQGFSLRKNRIEFPFQVTSWLNLPIKSKSSHHSPPSFLILIKVLLLPYLLWNGTLKSKVSVETLWIKPEFASFSCTFFPLNIRTELNMWLKSMAVSSLTFLKILANKVCYCRKDHLN